MNICSSNSISIRGEIASGDAGKLNNILAAIEKKYGVENCRNGLLMIIVNSNGGDANEALNIGKVIRNHSLEVVIPANSNCLSSCVFLVAGGVRRMILGNVGIHRPYFESLNSSVSTADIKIKRSEFSKKIRDYLDEMDVSQTLLEIMLSVPPESIRILTDDELQNLRLSIEDATFNEKTVSMNAANYNISSSEFRKRDAESNSKCRQLSKDRKYEEYTLCRERVLVGLTQSEAKRRLDRVEKYCDEKLSDKQWIECKKNFLVLGN